MKNVIVRLKEAGSRFVHKVKGCAAVGIGMVLTSAAHAQAADAVPTPADILTKIGSIGGIAGACSVLGLSIWLYQRSKRKAGQSLA